MAAFIACFAIFWLWGYISLHFVLSERLADSTVPHSIAARAISGENGRKIMGAAILTGSFASVNTLLAGVSAVISFHGQIPTNFSSIEQKDTWRKCRYDDFFHWNPVYVAHGDGGKGYHRNTYTEWFLYLADFTRSFQCVRDTETASFRRTGKQKPDAAWIYCRHGLCCGGSRSDCHGTGFADSNSLYCRLYFTFDFYHDFKQALP
jgi:hypothetical protein